MAAGKGAPAALEAAAAPAAWIGEMPAALPTAAASSTLSTAAQAQAPAVLLSFIAVIEKHRSEE